MKVGEKLYKVAGSGVRAMFMGQYGHTIDIKGRVIIPAKYRESLGSTFVITLGLDGCLFLYPLQEWQSFVDKLQGLPSNQKTRRLQRQFLSKAMEVMPDKQGRILIPSILRDRAGLSKEVIFIGMMNRVEVWDKGRLEEQDEEDDVSLCQIMDELDIPI